MYLVNTFDSAFVIADKVGRIWATRQLCLTWIIGIIIFMTNGGRLSQIYAGRFIAGLGIGETTVIAPVYIAEISPKSVRGLATCVFSGSVYLGIMLAYFASWGSSLHINRNSIQSWLVPNSLHLIFAGIIFILSFFNYESPRFLIKKGNVEQAYTNLARVRNLPVDHEYINYEISGIQRQLEEEQESTRGQGFMGYVKEIFCQRDNLYRISIGLGAQLFSQWSGAGSITLYAPQFFQLLGVQGQNEKVCQRNPTPMLPMLTSHQLFATCVFGVVKFISALICALFLVDVIGRKRALSIGITFQAIAMVYIAGFLTAVPKLQNPKFKTSDFTSAEKHASTGAIAMIYISGVGWAMGWNSLQYLINAEIYPLRIRAICSSIAMCFHFANQYGNSRAVPVMLLASNLGGLSPKGTFWFFAVITLLGLAWAWFFIPETANIPLERIDELFKLKWYEIGRKGAAQAYIAEARDLEKRYDEKSGAYAVEVEVAGTEHHGTKNEQQNRV